MLKLISVLLFRLIPGVCTLYVLYFFALGGLHPYAREHDFPYLSENCPALVEQVGPLEVLEHTDADWSPFVTEYRYVPDGAHEAMGVFDVGKRDDLSALSCFPLFTCLLPPTVYEKCEKIE